MYKLIMSILNQKTISKKITFNGIGIHSGKKVNLHDLLRISNFGRLLGCADGHATSKDGGQVPHSMPPSGAGRERNDPPISQFLKFC